MSLKCRFKVPHVLQNGEKINSSLVEFIPSKQRKLYLFLCQLFKNRCFLFGRPKHLEIISLEVAGLFNHFLNDLMQDFIHFMGSV